MGLRGADGDALELTGVRESHTWSPPSSLPTLDLGLVLVIPRSLVVLAVLSVVLRSLVWMVYELGYVGLVVATLLKKVLTKKKGWVKSSALLLCPLAR